MSDQVSGADFCTCEAGTRAKSTWQAVFRASEAAAVGLDRAAQGRRAAAWSLTAAALGTVVTSVGVGAMGNPWWTAGISFCSLLCGLSAGSAWVTVRRSRR